MSSLRLAMGVRAASSLGVDDEALAAAAGVSGCLGVVGLGGGVLVISPKGFRTPVGAKGRRLD